MVDLEEIKNRLDIVDVLQQYLRVEKSGANWKARCPFHNEKTPSFVVSQDKQIWHCFGCGEGGDIFSFVMKIEGIEFKDALKILAERAGIKLEYSRQYKETKNKKDVLYEINEWATKFFATQLFADTANSKQVFKYLTDRGLKNETIKNFRIGYAPKDWHSLRSFLNGRGYKDMDIQEAGLAIKSENGFHDRFRGRIMFPIADIQGRVAGFTGRVFESFFTKEELENQGKYVNSPETLVYNKGKILYGLDQAKVSLRKTDLCILVEGNMDLIMSHQSGVDNVVAVSGTSLTEFQVSIIKRYTENLAMAFDQDEAGNLATKRSIDVGIRGGVNVKIINVSGGKDPADVLKENGGIGRWKKMIEESQGVMDFYFTDAFFRFKPNTAENKREITKLLLPIIKKIQNKVEQHHWLHTLADRLDIKEEFLVEALNDFKARKVNDTSPISIESRGREVQDQLGENLLGLVVAYYEAGCRDVDFPDSLLFMDSRIAEVYRMVTEAIKDEVEIKDFYGKLSTNDKNYLQQLALMAKRKWFDRDKNDDEEDSTEVIKNDIEFLLNKIRLRKIKQDLNNLAQDIKRAESERDVDAIELLKEEFKKMAEQLK